MAFLPQYPAPTFSAQYSTAFGSPPLQLVASIQTTAGFALQNATPTLVSWTAPNDGNAHRVVCFMTTHVTSAETGGGLNISGTSPDGTGSPVIQLVAGGKSLGTFATTQSLQIAPNTTVSVVQAAALTVGAAVAWVDLWGE